MRNDRMEPEMDHWVETSSVRWGRLLLSVMELSQQSKLLIYWFICSDPHLQSGGMDHKHKNKILSTSNQNELLLKSGWTRS